MINGKKVVVIMPAYNAEKTLKQTYDEIYKDFVDEVILVDDGSKDNSDSIIDAYQQQHVNYVKVIHK